MSAVDVLAVMDHVSSVERDWGDNQLVQMLAEARAAVAELLDACNERNEAEGQYGAAEKFYDENSNAPEMVAARGRMIRATKRYAAALARCKGEGA